MILHNTATKYKILNHKLDIYSDITSYGLNTVVEIFDKIKLNGFFYYAGNKEDTLQLAIDVWQYFYGSLTAEELEQVIKDNAG